MCQDVASTQGFLKEPAPECIGKIAETIITDKISHDDRAGLVYHDRFGKSIRKIQERRCTQYGFDIIYAVEIRNIPRKSGNLG